MTAGKDVQHVFTGQVLFVETPCGRTERFTENPEKKISTRYHTPTNLLGMQTSALHHATKAGGQHGHGSIVDHDVFQIVY